MKIQLGAPFHRAALGLVAIGLLAQAGGAPAPAESSESIPPNSPPALIQGMRVGTGFFSEPHTACVQAIDATLIPNNEERWNKELPIVPGPHLISVRYYFSVNMARTTFSLVVKPGARYQVRCAYKRKWADLWIIDLASGKPVTPITRVVPALSKRRQMALYDWPTGGAAYEQGGPYGGGLNFAADAGTLFPNQNPGVQSLQLNALRELSPSTSDVDHPELFNHGPVNKGDVAIGPTQVKDDPAPAASPPAQPAPAAAPPNP